MSDLPKMTLKELREELMRRKGLVLARIAELPEGDTRRAALEGRINEGDDTLARASRTVCLSFEEGLEEAQHPVQQPVVDLFADRDPEEREQAAAALSDLLQEPVDTHTEIVAVLAGLVLVEAGEGRLQPAIVRPGRGGPHPKTTSRSQNPYARLRILIRARIGLRILTAAFPLSLLQVDYTGRRRM